MSTVQEENTCQVHVLMPEIFKIMKIHKQKSVKAKTWSLLSYGNNPIDCRNVAIKFSEQKKRIAKVTSPF